MPKVKMTHPELDTEIEVREGAAQVLKKSGWTEKKTATPQPSDQPKGEPKRSNA